MKPRLELRVVLAALALGLAVVLLLGMMTLVLGSTLNESEQAQWSVWWGGVLAGRWPLLVLLWLGFVAMAAAVAQRLWRHYVQPLAHMTDGVDVLLKTDVIDQTGCARRCARTPSLGRTHQPTLGAARAFATRDGRTRQPSQPRH